MKRLLFLLISILIISCSPVKKYQTLPEVVAWEPDIQKFEQLDKSVKYPEDAILFAGSSSIRLWSTLEKDMAPYPVIQRGYGGAKLSDFVVYADRIFSPHPCKAIVIFVANDIYGGDNDKIPREVAGLFRTLLRIIRKTHPETPVFWIAVTPSASRWKVWPQINEASSLIKDICDNQYNTYFIRTDFAFLNEAGQPKDELFRSDRLHLTEKGYAVWTEIIKMQLSKIIPMPMIEIIGHRGSSFTAPENTVASAKKAWEEGADAVEADVYLSKDNKIMVIHDSNTRRTSGKDYLIGETNSEILRSLDVGSFKNEKYKGEKIPFLEEIISTVPDGKELVIEIKCGIEVLPPLKEVLNTYGKNKKFVFIAFDFETISATKKAFPENPCYWLCSNPELLNKNINLVPGTGIDGISLSYNIIDANIADQAKRLNLDLFTWTVDNPDEAKRLISLGVKGVTTNRPGWMREQIALH
jgi:glycerophosphoryl diester phosphodiesterase